MTMIPEKNISEINVKQALIGLAFLFCGVLYYLLVREPHKLVAQRMVNIEFPFIFISTQLNCLKVISPSFFHSTAFVLISGAMLPNPSKRNYILMAFSWATIGIAFEFGQLFKLNFEKTSLIGRYTTDYFRYGTFDISDIFQTIFGCVLAVLILTTSKRSEQ